MAALKVVLFLLEEVVLLAILLPQLLVSPEADVLDGSHLRLLLPFVLTGAAGLSTWRLALLLLMLLLVLKLPPSVGSVLLPLVIVFFFFLVCVTVAVAVAFVVLTGGAALFEGVPALACNTALSLSVDSKSNTEGLSDFLR